MMPGSIKYNRVFIIIALLFLLLRIGGIDVPYHQDEVKWVRNATTEVAARSGLGHPPIAALIYTYTAKAFGQDFFRLTPLFFGFLTLLVLYLFVRETISQRAALWSSFLYTISFYSVWGSLTVDTDGSILPFFFISSLWIYRKLISSDSLNKKIRFSTLLLVFLGLGFLTKLSFILVIIAIVFDYFFLQYHSLKKIRLRGIFLISSLFIIALATLYLVITFILPDFSFSRTFSHATDFINFSGRNFFQVIFQLTKAIIYASPLLFLPLFMINKEKLRKHAVLFIYLLLALIFYVVIFDFSSAALDKYLALIAVPLSIIGGSVIADHAGDTLGRTKYWLSGLAVGVAISAIQFISHAVPPLYPKDEWLGRVLSLKWDFLTPFMGGSGPVGFYMSWYFISLMWLCGIILVFLFHINIKHRSGLILIMLITGSIYNLFFVEEYQFGKINGNVEKLIASSVAEIKNNENIKSVITYNDIGGYELTNIGKYQRRLYAIPKNESGHREILESFKGHYLVIDMPRINSSSLYMRYFSTCSKEFSDQSQAISVTIYDCRTGVLE